MYIASALLGCKKIMSGKANPSLQEQPPALTLLLIDRQGIIHPVYGPTTISIGSKPRPVVDGQAIERVLADQPAMLNCIHQAFAGNVGQLQTDHSPATQKMFFAPLWTATDQEQAVLWITEDFTQQPASPAEALEPRKLIEMVLEEAPVIVFMIDPKGIIRISAGKGLAGIRSKQEDTTGKSIFAVYGAESEVAEYFYRAMHGEKVDALLEMSGYRFDTHYIPLYGANGAIEGVIGVATDVTQIMEAEKERYRSEARFRSIFEETEIGVVLQDLTGHILEANPAFHKMLGYSDDDLRQKAFADFTYPADLPRYIQLYRQLINEEFENFQIDKRYLRSDGQVLWARLNASLLRESNGKPQAVILMVEDVTTRHQLEAELNEVQHRLMQNRELERLQIARDLHDGPLQELYVIGMNIREAREMTQDKALLDKLEEMQISLEQQIHEMRSYLSELRPPTLAPFGLEKAIRSHAENFENTHPGIQLTLDLMVDRQTLPEQIRLALYRIYQELMNNIIRHAEASEIHVRFAFTAEQVILEIKDNGRGIPTPVHWVSLVRNGHLGLAGVKERAESIGGALEIDSQLGQGTTVRVIAPRDFRVE